MSIKTSDRHVSPFVWVSAQIYFASKQRLGSCRTKSDYRARLNASASLLSKALLIFKKYLNFDDRVVIRISSIKKKSLHGVYYDGEKLAVIRYRTGRNSFKHMLETMAHELVHAEQFHTGKLKYAINDQCKWAAYWNGKQTKMGSTYKSYINFPWEKEAFSRQEGLASMVYLKLVDQIDTLTDIEREVLR